MNGSRRLVAAVESAGAGFRLRSPLMSTPEGRKPRLLIIDDERANVVLLERVLAGFNLAPIAWTCDPTQAVELFLSVNPDLVLLDWQMPGMNGYEVLVALKAAVAPQQLPPVLVITGDASAATRNRALSGGAKDFIAKPFDPDEVRLRVTNLLETEQLHRTLKEENVGLVSSFRDQTIELEEARIETVERLALVGGLRDDITGQHNARVARTAGAIAAEIGTVEFASLLGRVAALHDIGKVGIPDSILLKAGPLSPEEWVTMKTHTTIGAHILSSGRSEFMRQAEQVARYHHERWDGTGYPDGLRGTRIPLPARIVTIADVYDALVSDRPYRPAFTVEVATRDIEMGSGTRFDPTLVTIFLRGLRLSRLGERASGERPTRGHDPRLQRLA
jgi:putative two-component system response regulator